MDFETAKWVIEQNRTWNSGQTSVSLAFNGQRTKEDDMLDERRATLAEAWRVVRQSKAEKIRD
jgi:hypothetical protein